MESGMSISTMTDQGVEVELNDGATVFMDDNMTLEIRTPSGGEYQLEVYHDRGSGGERCEYIRLTYDVEDCLARRAFASASEVDGGAGIEVPDLTCGDIEK